MEERELGGGGGGVSPCKPHSQPSFYSKTAEMELPPGLILHGINAIYPRIYGGKVYIFTSKHPLLKSRAFLRVHYQVKGIVQPQKRGVKSGMNRWALPKKPKKHRRLCINRLEPLLTPLCFGWIISLSSVFSSIRNSVPLGIQSLSVFENSKFSLIH
jgi:hypothetical protein